MIDEKKLLGNLIPLLNKHGDMYLAGRIVGVIDNQPKISEWIPCSERMPEKETPVLCQWHKRNGLDTEVYFSILHIDGGGEWVADYGMPNGEVVAWQPLPDAYKGKERKEA